MINSITFDRVILNFASAVKKLRAKSGMSQGDIFRKSGLDRTYISRLENGLIDDPRLTTVVILARALGVSVDDLVREAMSAAADDAKPHKKKKG